MRCWSVATELSYSPRTAQLGMLPRSKNTMTLANIFIGLRRCPLERELVLPGGENIGLAKGLNSAPTLLSNKFADQCQRHSDPAMRERNLLLARRLRNKADASGRSKHRPRK